MSFTKDDFTNGLENTALELPKWYTVLPKTAALFCKITTVDFNKSYVG